jgi:penicillin-insensitive murein endopeptidase
MHPRTKVLLRTWLLYPVAGLLPIALLLVIVPWIRVVLDDRQPSQSVGHLSNGRLLHGHVIPPWGLGFVTYSFIGSSLGSQYLHGAVKDSLVAAFAERYFAAGSRFVVGEGSIRSGGRFHGHLSHQNGLSIDVFMPIRKLDGRRAVLPTWPWNGFGYWWEFDSQGKTAAYQIDFDELTAFLESLDRQTSHHGLRIVRVIIDPDYVPLLMQGNGSKRLSRTAGKLTRSPVAVRHDEHVHIDFALAN